MFRTFIRRCSLLAPYAASQQTAYSVGIGGSGGKNQLVILGSNGMPHHYQIPHANAAAAPSPSPQEQHNIDTNNVPIPILPNVGLIDNNNSIV